MTSFPTSTFGVCDDGFWMRRSVSKRFAGYFFISWTVVCRPSCSGIFHSSSESHWTGRRCGKSEVDSKLYGPVTLPIPSTVPPSEASTTSPSSIPTTKLMIWLTARPVACGVVGYFSASTCWSRSRDSVLCLKVGQIAESRPPDRHTIPIPHKRPSVPRLRAVAGPDAPVSVSSPP